MHKIKEVILVEGKYDKNTLSQFLDATIMETKGFGVFSDTEKMRLIARLAIHPGMVILTDSDSAGFLIRNHLKGKLQGGRVLHAYIPDRFGKERRKAQGGKEGKLGVEGMHQETILQALKQAGATFLSESTEGESEKQEAEKLTKVHLYEWGLTGHPDSKEKRKQLLKNLDFPENLNANGMLDVLNAMYDFDESMEKIKENM